MFFDSFFFVNPCFLKNIYLATIVNKTKGRYLHWLASIQASSESKQVPYFHLTQMWVACSSDFLGYSLCIFLAFQSKIANSLEFKVSSLK